MTWVQFANDHYDSLWWLIFWFALFGLVRINK